MDIFIINKQKLCHKLYYFARSVVLSCIFVVSFGESSNQFFKNIPHFDIADFLRAEVCFFTYKFLKHYKKQVFLFKSFELLCKIELSDYFFAYICRKPIKIVFKIFVYLIWIFYKSFKSKV